MALFDYESAGAGISKNAAKKTGAKLFFDILFRKFWQIMGINLLYLIFLMPLLLGFTAFVYIPNQSAALLVSLACAFVFALTIGPATAGVSKIMRCYLVEKHTYIIRDFFRAFKNNFKKASVIGFFDCLIFVSVLASLKVYPSMAAAYDMKILYIPMTITLSFALVVLMMNFYIFLMLTATSLSLKNLLKNSFALSFIAMKKNILNILVIILTSIIMFILFLYVTPVFVVLITIFPAAFLIYVVSFNSYPVIQKYVIDPYYTSIGEINPEYLIGAADDEEVIFEDMGGKEKPIEKRKKSKGKRIS